MIEPCSVNVTDLVIFRRTATGTGDAGDDVRLASDLDASMIDSASGSLEVGGRDVTITNTLLIDGVDKNGDVIKVKPFDLVQWTDPLGTLTKKLSIARVTPQSEPGRGVGAEGLAHVRLEIGN